MFVCSFASVIDIAALKSGDTSVTPLAAGVADKLRDAVATSMGRSSPQRRRTVGLCWDRSSGCWRTMRRWRRLRWECSWDGWRARTARRWLLASTHPQLDVPTFNVATVCLSLGAAADECGAPSPAALLGLGIPASPPGAATLNQMSRGMYGAPPPLVAPMANLTTATATTRSPHLAADGAAHGMWRQARLQF